MQIQVSWKGGFGNRLIQYVVARLIGKRLIQNVVPFSFSDMYPFTSGDRYLSTVESYDQFDQIKEDTLVHNCLNPCYKFPNKGYPREIIVNEQNFLDVLNNPEKYTDCAVLMVDGFFQSKEFVLNYRDEIKELFGSPKKEPPIEGVFVHCRLGDRIDIDETECFQLQPYLHDALSSMPNLDNITEKYISSDSLSHPITQGLISKFNLKIYKGATCETLSFGARFSNKILSWGTFGWWIGLLNNQNNIICPSKKRIKAPWYGDIFVFDEWNKV